MNKIVVALLIAFSISGCASLDDLRDKSAAFIETDARATRPDRVLRIPQYIPIPDEFVAASACPPPTMLSPQRISELIWQSEIDTEFTAALFSNNETCFLNAQRIRRYNATMIEQHTPEDKSND